ncbi:hypothetical protein CVT91_06005 [Candidatus Atribacteria bacterium HGW-Atribacteria-1]|nr:MAG: hypothetical protein CVT91_06005 [Candidatus Atribacteria bacterium HGW-Atribacteria-1]
MKRLSGGIDVGSGSHHILILDDEDNVLYNKKISHRINEFAENIMGKNRGGNRDSYFYLLFKETSYEIASKRRIYQS